MPRLILTRLAGGLMLVSVVLLIPLLLGTGTSLFTVGPFTWPTPAEVNITVYYSFPVSSIARFPLIAKFLVACCSAPGLLGVTLAQCRWLGRLSGSLALLGQIGMALFTFLLLGISGTNAVHLLSTLDSTSTISWPWIVVLPFAASLALGLGLTGCGLLTGKERELAGSKGPLLLLGLWLLVGNLGLGWLQWTNP